MVEILVMSEDVIKAIADLRDLMAFGFMFSIGADIIVLFVTIIVICMRRDR